MAQIKFKTLTFRNFMSYGNTLNRFEFRDGMIWCCGSNGFGKSTIVEALNFALYGDSYRGGNKPDLINTMNPGCELSVELEFDICQPGSDTWDSMKIIRTLKASQKDSSKTSGKFDLYRLEDEKWVVQNKRAGFSQEDFEENYLGFNEVLFKSGIAFNTQEAQPFIELPAQKRRDITESIIAMQLGPWKKANGKRLNEATIEFDVASSEYSRLGDEIANLEDILSQLKDEKRSNIADLKSEIGRIRDTIKSVEASAEAELVPIAAIEAEIDAICGKINSNDCDAAAEQTAIDDIASHITSLQAGIVDEVQLNRRIAVLDSGKQAVSMKSGYETAWNAASGELSRIEVQYAEMGRDADVAELTSLSERSSVISSAMNQNTSIRAGLDGEVAFMGTRLDELINTANKLVEGVPCPMCGKPSTHDDVERHKEKLRAEYKEVLAQKRSKEGQIADINAKNAELQAELDGIRSTIEKLNGHLNAIGEFERATLNPARASAQTAKSNLEKCISTIAGMGIDITEVEAELSRIAAQFAKNSEIRTQIADMNGDINFRNTKIAGIRGIIADLRGEITEKQAQIAGIRVKHDSMLAGNSLHLARISEIEAEIARLEQDNADDAVGKTERRLVGAKRDRESALSRMHNASDTKAICNTITDLCSDDGMKAMIFDIFIPSFNRAVAKNLARTNLPLSIVFNSKMEYSYEAGPGIAPTYKLLSQGQRRKVGFAIAMAFRDFVSMVGNFKLNFISFDEVVDQSTDNNAMRELLEIIRGMVDDIGCAFIITHRGDVVNDMFDYRLEVKNNGAYSRLGELEKL